MDLKSFFKPRKVAIMGASESDGLGGKTTKQFFECFADKLDNLYLINARRDTVFGRKCYPCVADVPGDFDLLVIATNKDTVYDAIKQAIPKNVSGVIVYASGYSETGNPEDIQMENDLKKLCNDNNIPLLGPNCAGYINFVDDIYPFGFAFDKRECPGKVGVVSQSGQVCTSLLISPKSEFSYLISSGNSKVTEIEDYLEFLVEDEDTGVIAAYMEGVTQPERFIKVLQRAAALGKPVVLLKSGRSVRAAEVAVSHTGSLTGSDRSFDALFSKFGVIRADDIEELASICNVLALMPTLPKRNAFGIMCGSGGESATYADLAELYGLNCPRFEPETLEKLKKNMPEFASPNNPLDTSAPVLENREAFEAAMRAIADDKNVDMIIVGMPLFDRERRDTTVMVSAMEKVMSMQSRVPVVAVPNIETGRLKEMQKRLSKAGIPLMPSGKLAFGVLRKVIDYTKWHATFDRRLLEIVYPSVKGTGRRTFSEHKSKEMIKQFGIPVPDELIARSADEAAIFASRIGYPVVMKVESADIPHKSDAGGVKLPIENEQEVLAAFDEIMKNSLAYAPDAMINGILIQRMLPKGLEVIIGVNNDPQFGPIILLGLGGVFVEVFKDVSLYPAPINRFEAMEMINSLKASVLFYNYRNSEALDVEALADTIVKVSDFAANSKDTLVEMDINPLFVYEKGKGVAAADALIVLND